MRQLYFFQFSCQQRLTFRDTIHMILDHPTVFAMGLKDDLGSCGIYFESTDDANRQIGSENVNDHISSEDVATDSIRTFGEDDESRMFEAREEFGGRREGFIFRLGSKGLGYYGTSLVDIIEHYSYSSHVKFPFSLFFQRITAGLHFEK